MPISFEVPSIIRPWINGRYVDVSDPSNTYNNINPRDGTVIAPVQSCSKADVDAAVASSKAAFKVWSAMSGAERGRIMTRCGQLMREYNDELARLETLDGGQPLQEREKEVLVNLTCSRNGLRAACLCKSKLLHKFN